MRINAPNSRDQSILEAACEGNIAFLDSVEDHVLQTAECASGCTALHWAAGANQVGTIRYLVHQRGFSVDCKVSKRAANGRTSLHYACRNGALQAAQCLVNELKADVNLKAKQGVTPFQLAVFQNRMEICCWLVNECGVDPTQVNDFGCGAVHWLGIVPIARADIESGEAGQGLIPLAQWLKSLPEIDFGAKQKSGHTSLHKAAWMGHLALVKFLHKECDLWDDSPDDAGNYAAVLADMANTPRHQSVSIYLREHASREREESCAILGLSLEDVLECTEETRTARIRAAYKAKVRLMHPDKNQAAKSSDFNAVQKAYHHLLYQGGKGSQSNPAHSLPLMLDVQGNVLVESKDDENEFFKASLLAVLLEYGDRGLDLSNVRKKWQQVWPRVAFPCSQKQPLFNFIQRHAGDVVEFRRNKRGIVRVHALPTRSQEPIATMNNGGEE